MSNRKIFEKKVKITGELAFKTAFHIGSGKGGELATDMGVLKDRDGSPILPGSTLKGSFRHFAEGLSEYLNLTACMLDSELSGINCVADENYKKEVYDQFKDKKLNTELKKLNWLEKHTCDICRLFGSPMQSSRICFSDGRLIEWGGVYQIRDGVCIDRDTETARHGAKYDFEAAPRDTLFEITIELENPDDKDLAIVAAVIAEWENGFRLGGFTSRGLGKVRLLNKKVSQLDYADPKQLKEYLLKQKMGEDDSLLKGSLSRILSS